MARQVSMMLFPFLLAWKLLFGIIPGFAEPNLQVTNADLSAGCRRSITEQIAVVRALERLLPLSENAQLGASAADLAETMARTAMLSHSADGRTHGERAEAHGYDFELLLENIGFVMPEEGSTDIRLAQRLTTGWLASPGHRRNLLDPSVAEVGTAVVRGATGYYAVQVFGQPRSRRVAP